MFPVENAVPLRYPPIVTWALIAVNCAVFLFEANLSEPELEQFLSRFALIPARYFQPELFGGAAAADYLPFATNMFLHGGWLHLILNMWTLWLFGRAIEDRLGPGRYVAFYEKRCDRVRLSAAPVKLDHKIEPPSLKAA